MNLKPKLLFGSMQNKTMKTIQIIQSHLNNSEVFLAEATLTLTFYDTAFKEEAAQRSLDRTTQSSRRCARRQQLSDDTTCLHSASLGAAAEPDNLARLWLPPRKHGTDPQPVWARVRRRKVSSASLRGERGERGERGAAVRERRSACTCQPEE